MLRSINRSGLKLGSGDTEENKWLEIVEGSNFMKTQTEEVVVENKVDCNLDLKVIIKEKIHI